MRFILLGFGFKRKALLEGRCSNPVVRETGESQGVKCVERYYSGDAGVLKIPNRKFFKSSVCSEPEFIRVEFNLSWRKQSWLLNKLLPAIPNFPLFAEPP